MDEVEVTEFVRDGVSMRARIVRDQYPFKPDFLGPILRLEGSWGEVVSGSRFTDLDSSRVDLGEAVRRFGHDLVMWEKYLRVFHGAKAVEAVQSNGVTYIVFDSPAYRDYTGVADGREGDVVSGEAATWDAYVNGDTYIVVEEHLVPACGGCGRGPDWVEDDSVGGFYGLEHARSGVADVI